MAALERVGRGNSKPERCVLIYWKSINQKYLETMLKGMQGLCNTEVKHQLTT